MIVALVFSFFSIVSFWDQDVKFRVNQLGYKSTDYKEAVIFSNTPVREKFDLKKSDNSIVGVFRPIIVKAETWGRFKYYYTIDFTSITEPGEYILVGQKSGNKSDRITISDEIYKGEEQKLMAFMQQQRCGYNPFLDMVCHKRDGRTMYGPMPDSTFIDVSGGWHDAGDMLKYFITGSYATAHMLLAYELYPESYSDNVNALGQKGSNGIPDILDEAKWGLDWILNMHPTPDQLFHQVADDRDHSGWKMPDNDPSDYGWGKNSYRVAYFATGEPQGLKKYKSLATGVSNLAGRGAAALALGYRIFKEIDRPYATKCLMSAMSLYRMGKENEGYQQGNSYGAPYRYNENTWTDDMEWGAAELYKSTGDQMYLEDAKKYAILANVETSWLEKDTMSHYELYPFINLGHYSLSESVDENTKKMLSGFYESGIKKTIERASKNTFGIGVPFIWCSNNLLTALITQIILYERMTGDMQYHNYMLKQRDWLFGRNPWGTSMFTGMPDDGDYPVDVHTSVYVKTKSMVPGGLIDGPVYGSIFRNLIGLTLLDPDEYSEVQNPYVVYHDDIGDYSTNEPTMDGTAGALLMMGYFSE